MPARIALFAAAVVLDASRLVTVPGLGARPVLFAALAAVYGLRGDTLAGGTWGFAGGLALGLLFADSRVGALALGGLLAGSVPAALKRLLFWQRWPGQAALGALAGGLYGTALVAVAALRGETAAAFSTLAWPLALDAALTGAACPALFGFAARLDRRR